MDVCIYGAGAVGGYLAAHLIDKQVAAVSIVARGDNLRAMREHGLTIMSTHGQLSVQPTCVTDRPADLPPQDIIFVTLKANALSSCAGEIALLLKPSGQAVFVTNGIPWWWNHGLGENGASGHLPLLDPQGELWNDLTPARVLGCVVYAPNEVIRPGVVQHAGHDRWLLGEPDGSSSERLARAVALLQRAGRNAETSADLRRDIWVKLLRNTALNSVCALTRLPVDRLSAEPALLALTNRVVDELVLVAAAQGWDIAGDAQRARTAPYSGGSLTGQPARGMKPSMLQDALAGRPMEVAAIVGQVQAFAKQAQVPCPSIDVIAALLTGLQAGILTGV